MLSSKMALAVSLALATPLAYSAGPTIFDEFTALGASAGPIPVNDPGETTPLTLSSPLFSQRMVASRNAQLGLGEFNSGAWDMITVNETGPDAGRYLYTVFETSQSGIQRTDLWNGEVTRTIWRSPAVAPALNSHVAFDASYWTPWGTYITAEENWTTAPGGATTNPYGRLFEVTNPLKPNATVDAVHRNAVARTSHEGIQFDSQGHMYYIDELNGGSLYRYTATAGVGDDFFDGGVNAVFQIAGGVVDNAVGAGNWIDFTDGAGEALAGALNIIDPNGVVSVDARNTTDLAAFKGTNYQRPEDLQIQMAANGHELLYMTTTTTNAVYVFDITTNSMSLFADVNTIDLATGLAVGAGLRSPDNLAIDAAGNIYIIEDRNGGVDDDIWFANDVNKDGDLLDIGEGLARWASLGTQGAELTGLYFDPFNPNRAWVNVQHPSSGNDMLLEITAVPVPAAVWLFGSALVGLVGTKRRSA